MWLRESRRTAPFNTNDPAYGFPASAGTTELYLARSLAINCRRLGFQTAVIASVSEAIHRTARKKEWIASSLRSSQ
jgi:hypothetical protein